MTRWREEGLRQASDPRPARRRRGGFTLLELLMALMILSVMLLLSFFCFDAVVQSWRAGVEMSDSVGQADHVMEQLVSGLRSAYYPDAGRQLDEYGFQVTEGGEGPEARDAISWVKIGRALVGEDCGFAESPHRVGVWVEDVGDEGSGGLMVAAHRVDLQLDDFDPEKDVVPIALSPRVVGLSCRMLDKDQPMKDDEPNWQDEWSFSNCIPKGVEITLYMQPAKERDEPIEVKRIVEIPMFDLSQNPRKAASGSTRGASGGRTVSGVGPGGRPPQGGPEGDRGIGNRGSGGFGDGGRRTITPGGQR
jgi:prepilin-type N-terminal cleavage/methylation domain-containing protein